MRILSTLLLIFTLALPAFAAEGPEIFTKSFGDVTVHTFMAPEKAALVTSHVIEGPTKLLVVDTQFISPMSKAFREYVDGLGKPVERVIITHSHPDHWFGSEVFKDQHISSFDAISARIAKMGQAQIDSKLPKMAGLVPEKPTIPADDLTQGTMVFDGIEITVEAFDEAEAKEHVVLTLPKQGVLVAEDLIYNKTHIFLGNNTVDSWLAALDVLEAKPGITYILAGHGEPVGPEVFGQVRAYLELGKKAIAEAQEGSKDIGPILKAAYPDYRLAFVLDTSNFVLFGNYGK